MSSKSETKTEHIPFSKLENKAYVSLVKRCVFSEEKGVTFDDIVSEIYPRIADRPFSLRESITSILRSLQRKLDVSTEPYRLRKTRRLGPHPTVYWLERSKSK